MITISGFMISLKVVATRMPEKSNSGISSSMTITVVNYARGLLDFNPVESEIWFKILIQLLARTTNKAVFAPVRRKKETLMESTHCRVSGTQ